MDGRMKGWMEGRKEGWMDEGMDGRKEGWMDEWMVTRWSLLASPCAAGSVFPCAT